MDVKNTVNLGRIQAKARGEFSLTQQYEALDFVHYIDPTDSANSGGYQCIKSSLGNLPTDTTYFSKFVSDGKIGKDGETVTLNGVPTDENGNITFLASDIPATPPIDQADWNTSQKYMEGLKKTIDSYNPMDVLNKYIDTIGAATSSTSDTIDGQAAYINDTKQRAKTALANKNVSYDAVDLGQIPNKIDEINIEFNGVNQTNNIEGIYNEDIKAGDLIYTEQSYEFVNQNRVDVFPRATTYSCAYSPDGKYFALQCASIYKLMIYKVSLNSENEPVWAFSDYLDTYNYGTTSGITFSEDSKFLYTSCTSAPFFLILKLVDGKWVLNGNLPDTQTRETKYMYSYNNILLLAQGNYVKAYKHENNEYVNITSWFDIPPVFSGAEVYGLSVNKDKTHIAIVSTVAPFLYLYKIQNESFVKIESPEIKQAFTTCHFVGNELLCGSNIAPWVLRYTKVDNDTFEKTDIPVLGISSLDSQINHIKSTTNRIILNASNATYRIWNIDMTEHIETIGIGALNTAPYKIAVFELNNNEYVSATVNTLFFVTFNITNKPAVREMISIGDIQLGKYNLLDNSYNSAKPYALSLDGTLLAVCHGNRFSIYNTKTLKEIMVLDEFKNFNATYLVGMDFSPDNKWFTILVKSTPPIANRYNYQYKIDSGTPVLGNEINILRTATNRGFKYAPNGKYAAGVDTTSLFTMSYNAVTGLTSVNSFSHTFNSIPTGIDVKFSKNSKFIFLSNINSATAGHNFRAFYNDNLLNNVNLSLLSPIPSDFYSSMNYPVTEVSDSVFYTLINIQSVIAKVGSFEYISKKSDNIIELPDTSFRVSWASNGFSISPDNKTMLVTSPTVQANYEDAATFKVEKNHSINQTIKNRLYAFPNVYVYSTFIDNDTILALSSNYPYSAIFKRKKPIIKKFNGNYDDQVFTWDIQNTGVAKYDGFANDIKEVAIFKE